MAVVARVMKVLLLLVLWGLFIFWTVEWCIYPTERGTKWKNGAIDRTSSTFLDLNAPYFLMWTFPVLIFALLALLYVELDQQYPERELSTKELSKWGRTWRIVSRGMWTQPLLVKTPLGILTAMDLLAISLVVFVTLWIFFQPLGPALKIVDASTMKNGIERWMIKVGRVGTWTGRAFYLPMALLFIPVSRGSPFLRLVNVPFEHAVRYHRWLGHFTLLILLLHSITFSLHIYYTGGNSAQSIFEWKDFGVSNLAGVISMLAGIVLWVTSLEPIRARFFDVFYITHHMYILVFAFGVWHVGEFSSFYFLGGVLLFFIDRFIRMVQSRQAVSILSARVLPSGLVELKFPKSPSLRYSALGFLYIRIPGISSFQWHPFSTTSSSMQGTNDMSICIKPLGAWTKDVRKLVASADSSTKSHNPKSVACPFGFQLFAEGPYGPQKDYFLRYKILVLVAGGVGITPFIAVLRDLLCRYQHDNDSSQHLPSKVHLIWCVRNASELQTLKSLSPSLLLPNYATGKLNIDVKAYITQPNLTSSKTPDRITGTEIFPTSEMMSTRGEVSDVRDSSLWFAAIIAAAATGFILFHGIFHLYVVRPNHHTTAPFFFEHGSAHSAQGPQGKPFPTWATVSLLFVSMLLGIVVCGGAVMFAWMKLRGRPAGGSSESIKSGTNLADIEGNEASLLQQALVTEGSRPNLAEIIPAIMCTTTNIEDVGVLVSGPRSMQEAVASTCRSHNFRNSGRNQFHYHSISFDL